jgi:pyruvate/2-oxoglutarate dehydrogenase complex dihydrolipoamide dehydrogenase (E3) component
MSTAQPYDAIVIGTGQGGKPLAGALAKAGWSVAVIEKDDRVGGTCVVVGCTPTKTMFASARVAHLVGRAAEYGVRTGPTSVDQTVVRRRKRDIVDSFSTGSQKGLEQWETLDLIFGEARFSGSREITVQLNAGGEQILTAPTIFINTGTRNAVPPIPGLATVPFLDSTSIMELDTAPEHLVVIGGGYIGLEFGQMFRRFGSRVTIIQKRSQLLAREDEDVAQAVAAILRDEGVDVLLDTNATKVASGDDAMQINATGPEGEVHITASALLVAVGRRPNSDMLNLAAAGIRSDGHGFIEVNDRLETSSPGIYALGDVTGGPAFTHMSYDDFRIIRANVLDNGSATTAGRMLPYAVFIDPQLGRVGLTERQAREQGLDYRVAKMPMTHVARSLEQDERLGFLKVLVDAETNQILGASILSHEGAEIMSMIQIAMMGRLPYTALRDGIFAHPSYAEALNNLFSGLE